MKLAKKVLITYGWNRIAYVVNKSLSQAGIKTYVGDISGITPNRFSKYTYKKFTYPSFYENPETFIDFIITYARKHHIHIIIPCHEELYIFSRYKQRLKDNNLDLLVMELNALKIADRKDLCLDFVRRTGVKVPQSIKPTSQVEMTEFYNNFGPMVVLKYVKTNSSKGVFYVKDEAQFEHHIESLGQFILQEFVEGTGYGVSALYNARGEMRALFSHKRIQEKLVTGGTSTLRTGVRNEVLENAARKILDSFKWRGVAMVEFKYNENTGEYWFIEINPRFWGSLSLAYYSGIDFHYLLYQIIATGDCPIQTSYETDIRVKWLLGSILASLSDLLMRKKVNPSYLLSKADKFDDFSISDPFAFVGESLNYLWKFLKTKSLNPTSESMVDIDTL